MGFHPWDGALLIGLLFTAYRPVGTHPTPSSELPIITSSTMAVMAT